MVNWCVCVLKKSLPQLIVKTHHRYRCRTYQFQKLPIDVWILWPTKRNHQSRPVLEMSLPAPSTWVILPRKTLVFLILCGRSKWLLRGTSIRADLKWLVVFHLLKIKPWRPMNQSRKPLTWAVFKSLCQSKYKKLVAWEQNSPISWMIIQDVPNLLVSISPTINHPRLALCTPSQGLATQPQGPGHVLTSETPWLLPWFSQKNRRECLGYSVHPQKDAV